MQRRRISNYTHSPIQIQNSIFFCCFFSFSMNVCTKISGKKQKTNPNRSAIGKIDICVINFMLLYEKRMLSFRLADISFAFDSH